MTITTAHLSLPPCLSDRSCSGLGGGLFLFEGRYWPK
jgi:hypothetical protein